MKGQQKWVAVTGATSGIGRAVVEALLQLGYRVIACGRDQQKLDELQAEQSAVTPFGHLRCNSFDVADEHAVRDVFAELHYSQTTLDGLVTAAGSSSSQPLSMNTSTGFTDDMATNALGTYLAILYFSQLMTHGGSIVTVASIRGQTPTPAGIGYAASKAAVIEITRSSALQLAPQNIRVNCVSPGAVFPTGMSSAWSLEKQQRIAASVPLKRLASPQDIANSILFLLSDKAAYITGQTININGGELMP